MDHPPVKAKKKDVVKMQNFKSLLNNETFYLKILFLEHIINKISHVNEQLQSQTLDVSKLKTRFKNCFNFLLEIVCKPEKFETLFPQLISNDWEDLEIQQEYFLQGEDFIQSISELVSPKLSK